MIVIADTDPLISLCVIGQIELLEKLYTEYFICETVLEELKNNLPEHFLVDVSSIFESRTVSVKSSINPFLQPGIDAGEAESLLLFKELNADLILLEDAKARKYASSAGIPFIGTIAVLIEGKKLGFLTELRSHFISLLNNNRYYSTELLNNVLASLNEAPI